MTDHPLPARPTAVNERIVLLVLGTVQFTSIVDFMVVMPLEPQLARSIGLTPARFGLVVSSYAFAAGLAGLLASTTLDRFARRPAFLTLYSGFLAGTLACGLSTSYPALLAARFLTGAFGGVLGGMALAIIGDVFPENRRGAATGALMSAFALASVFGVPVGLSLGQRFGWHVPFVALAVLGLPILFLAAQALPRLDTHLGRASTAHPLRQMLTNFTEPNHLRAFGLTVAMHFGAFVVLPFLSPFLVHNVHIPERSLPLNYIAGGALTLVCSPMIGRLADRVGKLRVYRVAAPATAVMILVMTNLPPVPVAVAVLAMSGMMVCNAGRMVPAMAMITSSVASHRRGGFLGANSAVQHMAAGLGSSVAGLILSPTPGGAIRGFPWVGLIGASITLFSVWLAGRLRLAEPEHASTVETSIAAAAQASDAGEPLVELEAL